MNKPRQFFFCSTALLIVGLAYPRLGGANTLPLAGVAGPAVNLIYAYVAQDTDFGKSMVSTRAS